MTINDPELARIIKNKLPIDINGKQFIVESSKGVAVIKQKLSNLLYIFNNFLTATFLNT